MLVDNIKKWGSEKEKETKKRIQIAVYAYAYEVENNPVVGDSEFDLLAQSINKNTKTNNPEMDAWFEEYFEPYTGNWIHKHPYLKKIQDLYNKHYKNKTK
jgi:hypothetical protein